MWLHVGKHTMMVGWFGRSDKPGGMLFFNRTLLHRVSYSRQGPETRLPWIFSHLIPLLICDRWPVFTLLSINPTWQLDSYEVNLSEALSIAQWAIVSCRSCVTAYFPCFLFGKQNFLFLVKIIWFVTPPSSPHSDYHQQSEVLQCCKKLLRRQTVCNDLWVFSNKFCCEHCEHLNLWGV